jgi:outer membrane protein OmpA-like peptidoglycan-associated protein
MKFVLLITTFVLTASATAQARDRCTDATGRLRVSGCSAMDTVHVVGDALALPEAIRFAPESVEIPAHYSATLDAVALFLKEHPRVIRLRVQSHTAAFAFELYNERLSQERADAIVSALLERGVRRGRVEGRGMGASQRRCVGPASACEDDDQHTELLVLYTEEEAPPPRKEPVVSSRSGSVRFFVGSTTMPLSASGLLDADASDWELFGLKTENPRNDEGRVFLPFSIGNGYRQTFGLRLGLEFVLGENLSATFELASTSGPISGFNASGGLDLSFPLSRRMRMGVAARAGVIGALVDFGTILEIPGYAHPASTPIGNFGVGDTLQATMFGTSANLGGLLELSLGKDMVLRADLGLQYAVFGDISFEAATVTLPTRDPAIVAPDGSAREADLSGASASSIGLYGMLGLSWTIF